MSKKDEHVSNRIRDARVASWDAVKKLRLVCRFAMTPELKAEILRSRKLIEDADDAIESFFEIYYDRGSKLR